MHPAPSEAKCKATRTTNHRHNHGTEAKFQSVERMHQSPFGAGSEGHYYQKSTPSTTSRLLKISKSKHRIPVRNPKSNLENRVVSKPQCQIHTFHQEPKHALATTNQLHDQNQSSEHSRIENLEYIGRCELYDF